MDYGAQWHQSLAGLLPLADDQSIFRFCLTGEALQLSFDSLKSVSFDEAEDGVFSEFQYTLKYRGKRTYASWQAIQGDSGRKQVGWRWHFAVTSFFSSHSLSLCLFQKRLVVDGVNTDMFDKHADVAVVVKWAMENIHCHYCEAELVNCALLYSTSECKPQVGDKV